jgi:hypothetical protein
MPRVLGGDCKQNCVNGGKIGVYPQRKDNRHGEII